MLFAIVISVVVMAFGALIFMGGAMSDNPIEGDKAGKGGGITFLVGLIMLAGTILAHIHHVPGF